MVFALRVIACILDPSSSVQRFVQRLLKNPNWFEYQLQIQGNFTNKKPEYLCLSQVLRFVSYIPIKTHSNS